MAFAFTSGKFQAFNVSGNPLAGGKVNFYSAGTSTRKTTYTTAAGTVANANPVVLDANGQAQIWLGSGGYKVVVTDASDVAAPDGTVDNFTAGGFGSINDSAGGFWPDVTAEATVNRLVDRLFVDGGHGFTGNRTGTQGGFVPTSTEGASWAPRDSRLFVASDEGLIQICGFVSNENLAAVPPDEAIAVAGFAIGNKASKSVWALYADVQLSTGNQGYGIEIAAKNLGADHTSTAYFQTSGVYGIWMPGGGDNSYGGSPANPNNCAIGIGAGNSTWNVGIVFFSDSLTRNGSGFAIAMSLAEKHRVVWKTALNTDGFSIRSDVSAAASEVSITATNNAVNVTGSGGATIAQFAHQVSGVNYWQIINAAAGAAPQLVAAGPDTNIDVRFTPKGAGAVRFGTHTGSGDTAVSGYITVKDAGGTVRKLAVIT